jgi:HSP20 family protein
MSRFSGKKPFHRELLGRQIDEIRNLLHVIETRDAADEAENRPRLDMFESGKEVVLEFDLPGFRIEDISLRICGITLILEAFRPREQAGGSFICLERSFGRFKYVLQVPGNSNPCSITAEYRKGVLRVICPKTDGIKVPIKEIED